MLLAAILINMVLFCLGGYIYLDRKMPRLNTGVKAIAAFVAVFVLVSYSHYIALIFSDQLWRLAGAYTFINVALIAYKYRVYKTIFSRRYGAGVSNRDVVFPLFVMLILTAYFFVYAKRWGDWDAIAIWNLHAKFLYDPAHWETLFGGALSWSHPDYPLMLPSLTAFFWRRAGEISPFVPALIAWFSLVLVPLATYCGLYRKQSNWAAMLAMSVFVVDNRFITIACSQGADTLLSLLILLAVILYASRERAGYWSVFMIGFIAAASTWVKNEGIMFFVVFTLVFVVCNYKKKYDVLRYFLGALLPLTVLLSFKLLYAPANDLVAANTTGSQSLLQKLTDVGRYVQVGKFMVSTVFYRYIDMTLLLFAALLVSPRFFRSRLFAIAMLMVAGYFMVYVTTPHDLAWHLNTSADRVLQHIYPALVFGIMLSLQQRFDVNTSSEKAA